MKKTTLLKTMLLLCALIVSSGSLWATEESATLDMTTAQTSPVVVNGVTFSWTSEYIITGASSEAANGFGGKSGTADMTITIPAGKKLTGISKVNGNNWGSTNINVYTGTDDSGTLVVAIAQGTNSYTISSNNTGTTYYLVNSASKNAWIKSLTITYDDASGSSIDAPSFSPVAGAVTAGTTITLTQASADAIRYTTDGSNPTKTTGTVYSSPIEITTATTIKAIAIKGDDVSSVASAEYTISVTAPIYSPDGGSYMQGTNITISSTGNTVYYNLTTDGSTPVNPTNASTEYTAPIVLGSGTTKIKAIAYDTYGNVSSVVSRTYTGIALASLPFSWTGTSSAGKSDLGNQTGVALNLGTDYADSNAPYRLKFDGVGKYVTIYTDSKPENVYFTAKLFNAASTGSKIKVQGSADGITFTDIEEFTISGAANATFVFSTSNAFAATHRAVKMVMSSKDQNVAVGTICVSCIPISTASGKTFATYVTPYALDFSSVSSNIKAYVAASTASAGSITFTGKDEVPANTPLLIKTTSAGATVNVPVIASAASVGTNYLEAGSGTSINYNDEDGYYYYILSSGSFQWANNSNVATNKAYLRLPKAVGANELTINFDDEAGDVTGIATVSSKKQNNGEYYNLNGQRVDASHKGIVIVNGKKFFNK